MLGEWRPGNPTEFWETRAGMPPFLSVMWQNPYLNKLAHDDQCSTIVKWIPQKERKTALDLGCGTGRLSGLLSRNFDLVVGVDIEKMALEAKKRNNFRNVVYVASTVQNLSLKSNSFDLIISMGCLSAACLAEELPDALTRVWSWLRPGGRLILIDPFHRWSFLARQCRLNWREVVTILENEGYRRFYLGGLHFFPFRVLLTFNRTSKWKTITNVLYPIGELFMSITSAIRLADYKVLVYEKPQGDQKGL